MRCQPIGKLLHILKLFLVFSKVRVPDLAYIIEVRLNHTEVQFFQCIGASKVIELSVE